MMASDDKPRLVWYCLKTPIGETYPETSADYVLLPNVYVIAQFRDAVLAKNDRILGHAVPSMLTVYKNEASLDAALAAKNKPDSKDKEEGPLRPSLPLSGLGTDDDDENTLMVVVPGRPTDVASPAALSWTVLEGEYPRTHRRLSEIKSSFVTVEAKYHDFSGLAERGTDVKLLCRPAFLDEADHLQKFSISSEAVCWVVGPPGSGKSCAAFAFAMSLDPSVWNVIWIHYSNLLNSYECVRFEGNKKATQRMAQIHAGTKIPLLLDAEQPKGNMKSIIFFDGYNSSEVAIKDVFSLCMGWRLDDLNQHRLVCVSSMSSLGKMSRNFKKTKFRDKKGNIIHYDQEEWKSWSWSLEEYLDAVKDDSFYSSVKAMLGVPMQTTSDELLMNDDASSNSDDELPVDRTDLVRSKFFIAGGNARFMFDTTTDGVIQILRDALESAPNLESYRDWSIGIQSSSVVNHLMGSYLGKAGTRQIGILSGFVARELAVRFGHPMIKHIKMLLGKEVNPSMDGHLLEIWFFAHLATENLTIWSREEIELVPWPGPNIISDFDPRLGRLDIVLDDKSPVWLRPIPWNNGGYDALYVNKAAGLVRFVQITRDGEHSFAPQFFTALLMKLGRSPEPEQSGILAQLGQPAPVQQDQPAQQPLMTVKEIELVFMVPKEALLSYKLLGNDVFRKDVVDVFNCVGLRSQTPEILAKGHVYAYGLDWKT